MRKFICAPRPIEGLAVKIASAGGRAYLVGGGVIDRLQGRRVKDWDLEVYGLSYAQLEQLFEALKPVTVGRAFGVLKLRQKGVDIDISIPRQDSLVGKGHKDFACTFDPTLTIAEAARRRDFTINAMALDVLSNELHDPFNGFEDLQTGTLRIVDKRTFVEDPLRCLRAMQLAARKAPNVDPETASTCRQIVSLFGTLPKERVYEEFKKLLMLAKKPSIGLNFLRDSLWITHFPELEALIDCPQNPKFHAEGDVWNHTLLVVDAAAHILKSIEPRAQECLMWAALLHDVGKPSTTKPDLTAHGHDMAGLPLAEAFLRRITSEKAIIEPTLALVGLHMQPQNLSKQKAPFSAWARLHRKLAAVGLDLNILAALVQSDIAGSVGNQDYTLVDEILHWAKVIYEKPAAVKPKVLGRDLLALGMQPGPHLGLILKQLFEFQLEDPMLTKDELIRRVLPK